jgi:hypothetical protein
MVSEKVKLTFIVAYPLFRPDAPACSTVEWLFAYGLGQYIKEQRALRTEPTINDFDIAKAVCNLRRVTPLLQGGFGFVHLPKGLRKRDLRLASEIYSGVPTHGPIRAATSGACGSRPPAPLARQAQQKACFAA